MLIRSQDKLVIIPLNDFTITVDTEEYANNRECNICVCKSESIFEIGHYSTKEKAIKVLDMIQEAYAVYESNKIINTGLAGTVYTGSYDTKESIMHGVKVLKEYAKTLTSLQESIIIFQMPEDSEVEV